RPHEGTGPGPWTLPRPGRAAGRLGRQHGDRQPRLPSPLRALEREVVRGRPPHRPPPPPSRVGQDLGRPRDPAAELEEAAAGAPLQHRLAAAYSHSMVPGGFEVRSSVTRFTPWTSLMIRLETRSSRS